MDSKYLAEIKAAFTTEMLTDDYREMRISEIAKLRLYGKKLLAEVERMTAEIATLKKALELACEEISDYALPSGTGRMKSVLITARIEKFMNHAKQVQEQEAEK